MIGRKISHFEITDKLGEGGMGEVWLARDTRLGRTVALKSLPPARAERKYLFEWDGAGAERDFEHAEAALRTLDERAEDGAVDPITYGIIYSAFGDKDRLLDELEKAVDQHSMLAAFMPGVPDYYMPGLENDPRFQKVMERLGFTGSGVHGGAAK